VEGSTSAFRKGYLDVGRECSIEANIHNGTAHLEKCKQLLEYQNLLLLSDIWWLKF